MPVDYVFWFSSRLLEVL